MNNWLFGRSCSILALLTSGFASDAHSEAYHCSFLGRKATNGPAFVIVEAPSTDEAKLLATERLGGSVGCVLLSQMGMERTQTGGLRRIAPLPAPISQPPATAAGMTPSPMISAGPVTHDTPFNGLALGDYLNAIYNRDLAEVARLDTEYKKGYAALLQATGSGKHPMGSIINEALAKISYVTLVLRTYIESYGDRYASCLDSDAVSMTMRTTVTQGFATRTSDKTYRMNKEFGAVYEEVAPSTPTSGYDVMGDLATGSRNYKTVIGTQEMMFRFKCDDSRIKHFESSLLAVRSAQRAQAQRR